MPQKTPIEWTRSDTGEPGYTSNPIRARRLDTGKTGHHCVKISPGCASCYAEAIDHRFGTRVPYTKAGSKLIEFFVHEPELVGLVKIKGYHRVFPGDMTDLFQEDIADELLDEFFAVVAMTENLTYQVLTKRPERAASYLADGPDRWADIIEKKWVPRVSPCLGHLVDDLRDAAFRHLQNLWLGTSIENQAQLGRAQHVCWADAALAFLSLEPLLEALGPLDLTGIGWVIVGGESGPGARECYFGWVERIVEQCSAAAVPCFVKQVGSRPMDAWQHRPGDVERRPVKLRDKKGGDPDEWPESLRVRQFPEVAR